VPIEVEWTRTINVDQFVPRAEIDDLYIDRPYYIVPDGEIGQQAFGVIRDAIAKKGMVAIGRVVLSTREHVIADRYQYEHFRRHLRRPHPQGREARDVCRK
jgi:DNA end-binding protein Ku